MTAFLQEAIHYQIVMKHFLQKADDNQILLDIFCKGLDTGVSCVINDYMDPRD